MQDRRNRNWRRILTKPMFCILQQTEQLKRLAEVFNTVTGSMIPLFWYIPPFSHRPTAVNTIIIVTNRENGGKKCCYPEIIFKEPRNEIVIIKIAFPRIDPASPESKPDTCFPFSCPLDRQLLVFISRLSRSSYWYVYVVLVCVSQTVQLGFCLAGLCSYLTSYSRNLLGKLIVFELVKDFSDVSEIRASYRVTKCPTLVPTS